MIENVQQAQKICDETLNHNRSMMSKDNEKTTQEIGAITEQKVWEANRSNSSGRASFFFSNNPLAKDK